MRPYPHMLTVLLALSLTGTARAHEVAEEMAEAASHFLAALTPEQKARATFEFGHAERQNWGFVPRPRQGLPFKDMTPAQVRLAHALMSTALSHRGYLKAATIMSLEQVLEELEAGTKHPVRDAELYFFTVFGRPATNATWGWRVEGHHLSVNLTLVNGQDLAAAPSFFGANPAEVKAGPRQGLRVLGAEEDAGRALLKSLTDTQRATAVIAAKAYSDILTGSARKAKPLAPLGLAASQMNGPQRALLQQLVREYAERHRPELARQDVDKIERAGWDKVCFAWAGSGEKGQPHYYRVQGPTFLIEYDNTQNDANHIHSAWRDFEGDFGEDLLRRHYEQTPHAK